MGNQDATRGEAPGTLRTIRRTRRQTMSAAARVAASAGLALAGSTLPASGHAAAEAAARDLAILQDLLAVERASYALLRDGLTQFTRDTASSGDRNLATQPTLVRIAQHDGRHLSLLTAALAERGAADAVGPHPGFAFKDFATFLQRAAALKQQHVATYVLAATQLEEVELRALVARILAVEARHAAYLLARVGEAPFSSEQEDLQVVANPLLTDTTLLN